MQGVYVLFTVLDVLVRALLVFLLANVGAFGLEVNSFVEAVLLVSMFAIVAAVPFQSFPFNTPANTATYWHSWVRNWITLLIVTIVGVIAAIVAGSV